MLEILRVFGKLFRRFLESLVFLGCFRLSQIRFAIFATFWSRSSPSGLFCHPFRRFCGCLGCLGPASFFFELSRLFGSFWGSFCVLFGALEAFVNLFGIFLGSSALCGAFLKSFGGLYAALEAFRAFFGSFWSPRTFGGLFRFFLGSFSCASGFLRFV